MRYVLLFLLIIYPLMLFCQIPWPHPPQDQVHPIGNSWGNFQDYGGSPYVHNGNDIMTQPLWPVTAVRDGYVKRIWRSGIYYTGITVADSAGAGFCSGYMYYHVDSASIRVQEGDTVFLGDTIAQIVYWPVYNFHHNHFSKNRNSGIIWSGYGGFFKNPLTELMPDDDSTGPVFTDALSGQEFAICRDNSSIYLSPDSVYGNVDLICRFEDRINHPMWWVAIYKIIYSIYDTTGVYAVPPTIGVQFSESLDSYTPAQVRVVYKDDYVCNSNCGYNNSARRLYYIFTNTDGDSIIEWNDSLQNWQTANHPDGPYWIKVIAYDEYGNSDAESMLVYLKNGVGIEEEKEHKVGGTYSTMLEIYPNPAKSNIRIQITDRNLYDLDLKIYDVSGQLIKSFPPVTDYKIPYILVWDRRDDRGYIVPSGVYFIKAKSASNNKHLKVTILH